MSTRNLARTAIEGGRLKHCRYAEHQADRSERQMIRRQLRSVYINGADGDDVGILDRNLSWRYGREFADKLSPVKRWLEKQCGRPWSKVYSEIKQTFDYRTTPGRHIVYDHIIDAYVDTYRRGPTTHWFQKHEYNPVTKTYKPTGIWESYVSYRHVFEIDDHGILRLVKKT